MNTANDLKQFAKEIHNKSVPTVFPRQKILTIMPDELWAADLVDMSNIKNKNKKITFLLNIIDVYSRYAFSFPLKNKSGKSILDTFKTLPRTPHFLWTDEGLEFYNTNFKKFCEEKQIHLYSTHTGLKSVFCERFNRTMKEAFYRRFTEKQVSTYTEFLPEFIEQYNNTVHSSTGFTPNDLYFKKKVSNELFDNIQPA